MRHYITLFNSRFITGVGLVSLVLLVTSFELDIFWPFKSMAPLGIASVSAQQSKFTGSRDTSAMILIPDEGKAFEYGIDPPKLKSILKEFRQTPSLGIYLYEAKKEMKRLPPYYIDKYEVTNGQYQRFCKETGHPQSKFATWQQFNGNRQPVVGVSWKDAEAYCKWAGKRLPSEEEWEKAARGTDGRIWPWGNKRDTSRFNGKTLGRYASAPVGSFPTGDSPYKVCDMAGNVWEMTTGPWPNKTNATKKTMRGGSFLNSLPEVRTTVRWATASEERGAEYLGFRCVMDANKTGR